MAGSKRTGEAKRFLMLPRLRQGHGIQVPESNRWTERPDVLAQISRNMDVQNSEEKGHSIPDIFSQSIQFEFDMSVGNADAVGQWQGLLATLLLAGAGGLARVRSLRLNALPDSPFVRIFRDVAARRGIDRLDLFELRRTDGSYGAVAFRHAGMPTLLCPAADLHGPFVVDDPWLVLTPKGWRFTAPRALLEDPRFRSRGIALRNEIHALSTRAIPAAENRDGLQLTHLQQFFRWLDLLGDDISEHPVHPEIRAALYTVDANVAEPRSEVFTDRICLFRVGEAYNHLAACAEETMTVYHGGAPTAWRALLPLRSEWAEPRVQLLREGKLGVRLTWRNGTVEAEVLDERDASKAFKRYAAQDLLNYTRHRNAQQIAVWPPKALEGWNRYYLLRYDDGNALPLTLRVPEVGPVTQEVTLLPRMPRCLAFSLEGEEVGLLLPAFETLVNPRAREFNLGFDFGTTGTTAYKHDPASGVTTPVSLADAGALFLFGRQEGADVALTAQLVSETIADRATHYTMLRRKAERLEEGRALEHTTIPFLSGAAFNPEIVRDVSDELKWGTLAADKLRAHLYLEQYLMMCLWHACQRGAAFIHWRASYPLSMHGPLQEDFVAKVQTLLSGLCANCYRMPYDASFCSESEAVGFMMMDNGIQAKYLEGLTINDETGFFCMDIGGGSTDFSLWLRRKPLLQASLRWAGNAILCDTVTRENHGEDCPPRLNLVDSFFGPNDGDGKRAALYTPLVEGRSDQFRRVWNILVDEITDSVKGLHRTNEPLLNYMNILRINLYLLFYFAGRMVREAVADGAKVGTPGRPLPVAVLGNGAKMMKMLYNDVEMVKRTDLSGQTVLTPVERRNEARYLEEMNRLLRVFHAGCGMEGLEAVIIEPFMPKQETARGLALAPEAYLLQRAQLQDASAQSGWPLQSAYELDEHGVVVQRMTDAFHDLVADSFTALRQAFADDDAFRSFLGTIFVQPLGAEKYNVEAYYRNVWMQCLRHNPEPMLPGQPLPQKNTIAGRFVEMLASMNRMMRSA